MADFAGPWTQLGFRGHNIPLYIIQFDEAGTCIAPKTRDALLHELKHGQYTHVLFFSHGWNNDWAHVTTTYTRFVADFHALADRHVGPLPNPYKPIFVGVFWPSISLVLPWEEAPEPAAAAAVGVVDPEIEAVSRLLNEDDRARFMALAGGGAVITVDEARELAVIFARVARPVDDVTLQAQSLTSDDLLAAWRSSPPPKRTDTEGGLEVPDVGIAGATPPSGTHIAGLLDFLDPRWIVRLATVRIMKDRAGVVGGNGVAALLNEIRVAGPQPIHAIGHSYGAKVLLQATTQLNSATTLASLLLLQPAVSYLSFAKEVGNGHAGGYSSLAAKIARPVFATFSSHDFPLTRVYHLALRRAADLGEVTAAAAAPSRYAALGGYGPPKVAGEQDVLTLPESGTPYPALMPGVRIVGLESSAAIRGHGDVLVDEVYWALLQQIT
jgi:hypothetical protein